MVEALVGVMRAHPVLPTLMHAIDKRNVASFTRATNDALELLEPRGFQPRRGVLGVRLPVERRDGPGLRTAGCPSPMVPEEAAEWRRQKRLSLEALPADRYPMMVAFAQTLRDEPDLERYYAFGIDLLMSGIDAMTRPRSASRLRGRLPGGEQVGDARTGQRAAEVEALGQAVTE